MSEKFVLTVSISSETDLVGNYPLETIIGCQGGKCNYVYEEGVFTLDGFNIEVDSLEFLNLFMSDNSKLINKEF